MISLSMSLARGFACKAQRSQKNVDENLKK